MLIRNTTYDDCLVMIQKLPVWLEGHPAYKDYTIDLEHTTAVVDTLWDMCSLYGKTLLDGDEIVGALVFTLGPPLFSTDLEAAEAVFFIEEHARGIAAFKLIKETMKYVQELGAVRFYMGAKSGHRTEALHKLYIRAGFTPTGGEYCWTKE